MKFIRFSVNLCEKHPESQQFDNKITPVYLVKDIKEENYRKG